MLKISETYIYSLLKLLIYDGEMMEYETTAWFPHGSFRPSQLVLWPPISCYYTVHHALKYDCI